MIRAAALAALLACPAGAADLDWLTQYKQPNLHYGRLAVRPRFRAAQVYDSNIYLVPPGRRVGGGERGSWITKTAAGLATELPLGRRQRVSAFYEADFHRYATEPASNDTVNQEARLDYGYRGPRGVTLEAGNRYLNTTDQASPELVERNRRWSNAVQAELGYAPENGRLTASVDGRHVAHKFLGADRARLLNRYEQRAGASLGYRLRPKTKVYAAYHRGLTHYTVGRQLPDFDKNSRSHSVELGVSGALAPKVEGTVEGGLVHREYDEAQAGGARTARNVTAQTRVTYRPDERTEATVRLERGLEESISDTSRFYVSSRAYLDVRRRLPRKLSIGASLAFIVDQYPDAGAPGLRNRRDDIYAGSARLDYDVQAWLTAGLSYAYRERNSTMSERFNYEDHQTGVSVALKF